MLPDFEPKEQIPEFTTNTDLDLLGINEVPMPFSKVHSDIALFEVVADSFRPGFIETQLSSEESGLECQNLNLENVICDDGDKNIEETKEISIDSPKTLQSMAQSEEGNNE